MLRTCSILIVFLIFISLCQSQGGLPYFLQGTWQIENTKKFEHWDKLSHNKLKGMAYEWANHTMKVSEYLEIEKQDINIVYNATVLHQNEGQTIQFFMTKGDSVVTFENNIHDYPNKISYQLIHTHKINVTISGKNGKTQNYNLQKIGTETSTSDTSVVNLNFDALLAKKWGADDYGMKTYFFIILKSGMQPPEDTELMAQSFRGHMDNIQKMVKENNLIIAGPILKNPKNYRGIFILDNVANEEELHALLSHDLAIKNGFLEYDIYQWYGSAALPEYLPITDKIWKLKP